MYLCDAPHHDGSALYVSNQYPALGETVSVFVRVPDAVPVRSLHVRTTPDGEQRFSEAVIDRHTGGETWWRADINCRNPLTSYRFLLERADGAYAWLNGTGLHRRDVTDSSDFRLTTHPAPPEWAARAVVYQVFPDRFATSGGKSLPGWALPAAWGDEVASAPGDVSRQVFGGDLAGLCKSLDYLIELGVDVVYLTPFFPGESNHRYDAGTFRRVDPLLGGEDALARLTEEAALRGVRVIGDLTTNHTGVSHEWFRQATMAPGGPERGFYYWDDTPHGYSTWLGVTTLPKLNYRSEELRARMYRGHDSVVRRWLKPPFNLSGWRIDVANMTGRHGADDLTRDVARGIRAAMAEANPDALLIAEHAHDYTADLTGDGWHGVMNYAGFTRPVWTWLRATDQAPRFLGSPLPVPQMGAADMVATMREFGSHVPWPNLTHSFNLLGSHDTTRIRTVTGGETGLVKVGAGLMMAMPGIPMICYGDEIGMEGAYGEDGRRPFPWDRSCWDEDLRSAYTQLIAARRQCPALVSGGLRWLYASDDAVVFIRETAHERVLVHCARAPHSAVRLAGGAVGKIERAQAVYGGTPLVVDHGTLTVSASGPAVGIWRLS